MDKISVLKSVFYKKIGSYWEHKLFWHNLDCEGQKLIINSELNDVIEDDFRTDRYLISLFLDENDLWDKFSPIAQKLEYNFDLNESKDNALTGWMVESKDFTLGVFRAFMIELGCNEEFDSFIKQQRIGYHLDCVFS